MSDAAQDALRRADVLAGGRRMLDRFTNHPGEKLPIGADLNGLFTTLARRLDQGLRVVVLTGGDPLFFGLGRKLVAALGQERVIAYPGVCTVQAAAAKLRTPWDDIRVVSLHGRPNRDPFFATVARHDRVAVYTDPRNTPTTLAAELLERGADDLALTVLESLGEPDERIRRLSPREAATADFTPLNIMLVEKTVSPETPLHLGLPDTFYADGGLVTKLPVRATALALLELEPHHHMWDLGAGSGAVGIEAARLLATGGTSAVEIDADRAARIRRNVRRCHAFHVRVLCADAGGDLSALPDPHRVFIGGGLGTSRAPLVTACERLPGGGVVVVAAVLLDTLSNVTAYLDDLGWQVEVTQLNAAVSRPLADSRRLCPDNPVFLIKGVKPGNAKPEQDA